MRFFRPRGPLALCSAVLLILVLVTACASAVTCITVEGRDDHTFVPNTITVNSGQTVDLTLVNNGKLDHTFTINDPSLNLEVVMRAGETNHITFTAPKPGEYVFSSGVITELDTMTGKLIVK